MSFNSYEYIFAFLTITFFVYFFLNKYGLRTAAKTWLLFASLFFYGWWNVSHLPLILSSILFNFALGNYLAKHNSNRTITRKLLLILAIAGNVGLLCYFKYADFFISNLNFLFNAQLDFLHLALPLAISFFTFQQIAYLVASYNGETKQYGFLNYALFVSFFPQLIAGPIVYHKEMLPQYTNPRTKVINYENIALGLFIFSIGLFKKAAIADTFAVWATSGFDKAEMLTFFEAWATSLSYTFQIYFDFSGYTDMAIGSALLFNIKLPVNFNSPYKALNIQDFWRRWHITFSRFLRDHVYIPLGGNRKVEFRIYSNLMATFLIGGLWHGAGWLFLFWGFLHGLAIIIHRIWMRFDIQMNKILAFFITFSFLNVTWVFFRAKEWQDATKVLKGMFGFSGIVLPGKLGEKMAFLQNYGIEFGSLDCDKTQIVVLLTIFFVAVFGTNSNQIINNFKFNYKSVLWSTLLFSASVLYFNRDRMREFLYFVF